MKKITAILLTVFTVMSLSACSENSSAKSSDRSSVHSTENESDASLSETESDSETKETSETNETTEPADKEDDTEASSETERENGNIAEDRSKILVAYFSCTNTTRPLAEYAAESLSADLYEIVPVEPYTEADLDYHDDNSRSTREMNDPAARPAISGSVEHMEEYEIVFIGYPIWWGMAPRAVCTFVEEYNWQGKTLIPFCTSNSSGVGDSAAELGRLCKGAKRTKAFSAYDDDILNGSLKKKIDKWLKNIKA